MRFHSFLLFACIWILTLDGSAMAADVPPKPPLPDAIAGYKLGWQVAAARTAGLQLEESMPGTAGSVPFPFAVASVADKKVGSLKGCGLQLRFYNQSLFQIETTCEDKEKTLRYLKQTYGPPTVENENSLEWRSANRILTANPKSGTFLLISASANQAFQLQLFTYSLSQNQQPANPTPSAAPAR